MAIEICLFLYEEPSAQTVRKENVVLINSKKYFTIVHLKGY